MAEYQVIQMPEHNNTLMHDPQALLAKSLETRNFIEFKLAMDNQADPTLRDPVSHVSTFEKALQTPGCSEFIVECIRRGVKCDYVNRQTGKSPITYAIDSRDPENIRVVLNQLPSSDANTKYCKLTPLISLSIVIANVNFDQTFECMKVLLEHHADPNIPDEQDKTPILHILNNKNLNDDNKREILLYMLNNYEIDLDTFRRAQARNRLQRHFPDIQLPDIASITVVNYDSLKALLQSLDEEKFIKNFNQYQQSNEATNNTEENILNLLLEATKLGLHRVFDTILETITNIHTVIHNTTVIEVACIWGNWLALQKILEFDNKSENIIKKNLLITVTKKLDEPTTEPFCDFHICFDKLIESKRININEVDSSKSTALHYAVKYRNDDAVLKLLKCGAFIGARSIFNDLPITDINPDILEEYFDSCISKNQFSTGDDKFEIIMNYKNFVPIPEENERLSYTEVRNEMGVVQHMSNAKDLRYLLKHPLITSFLFLKWHRLSVVFYINFFAYAFFCASLVPFIILKYINVNDDIVAVFHKLTIVGLAYVIIREIIQILLSPLIYIRFAVNYIEWILILLTTYILIVHPSYEHENERVIAVVIILLAALELCLLVGSLPILSISTHMLMLRAVLKTFLHSFSLYSIFLITFSLCFYILFGRPGILNTKGANSNGTDISEEDGEFNKFVNPFTAVIKTVVMLTGEFDAGDIDFRSSFYSYLIFLLFVFFMTIVLFNLLNGLAVSDTQAIKAQAELNGSICRTYILSNFEKALAGRLGKTSFFINLRPFRSICRRLTNIFSDYIGGYQIAILPNNYNQILVAERQPNTENGKTKLNGEVPLMSFYNNDINITEKQKKLLDPTVEIMPCCFACIAGKCSEMDKRTVKTALEILQKKAIAEKNAKIQAEQLKHQQKIEEVLQKTSELLLKLELKHL